MAVEIKTFKQVIPMIYAYNTPDVAYNDGWTKIGYTENRLLSSAYISRRTRRA